MHSKSHSPRSISESNTRIQFYGFGAFVLYSLLLLSPNVVALFTFREAPANLVLIFASEAQTRPLQVLGYALAMWVMWVSLCGRLFLACALVTPLLLLVPVEIYLEVEYHTRLLPHVFGILRESNVAEASAFLRGLWWPGAFAYVALGALTAIALRVLWRSRSCWRHRSRVWVPALFGILLIGLHSLNQRQEAWARDLRHPHDELTLDPPPLAIRTISDSFPFGLPLRYADYRAALARLAGVRESAATFTFGARQRAPYDGREAIVLVIGESARFDRWSINGYSRQTSPHLAREPNLVSLSNVVSVASATRLSVPVMLSRKPAERAAEFSFPERSLISAFHEAGYRTYWLSNQAPIGKYDTPVSVYASEADERKYFNVGDLSKNTPLDGIMLSPVGQILARNEPLQLIVIHTLGSHFDYRQRYPEKFDVFQPSTSPGAAVSFMDASHRVEVGNAYDNSILYSDYFLSQIIASLRTSGRAVSAMLYVSDHGEDLFDDGCGQVGHGRATPNSLRVPVFFWYSDEYAQRYPSKVKALRTNRDAKLTTENVFPTIIDAADIEFPSQDLRRSAASELFTERHRVVLGLASKADFDHARPNQRCELVD